MNVPIDTAESTSQRRSTREPYSYLSLGHREAALATDAIRAELARRGCATAIAVADAHGELISLLRLDGAPLASIVIAANKAWTAARERQPTRAIGQAVRDPESGFDIAYYGDSRYVGWGGGTPVLVDGAVVGSVAVSGLPELEDMELAQIGVAAIIGQKRRLAPAGGTQPAVS